MKHHQIECPYCGRQHGSNFSMYLHKPQDLPCRRCNKIFEVERCENNEYIMRKKAVGGGQQQEPAQPQEIDPDTPTADMPDPYQEKVPF